jgi:hypothetical protein
MLKNNTFTCTSTYSIGLSTMQAQRFHLSRPACNTIKNLLTKLVISSNFFMESPFYITPQPLTTSVP